MWQELQIPLIDLIVRSTTWKYAWSMPVQGAMVLLLHHVLYKGMPSVSLLLSALSLICPPPLSLHDWLFPFRNQITLPAVPHFLQLRLVDCPHHVSRHRKCERPLLHIAHVNRCTLPIAPLVWTSSWIRKDSNVYGLAQVTFVHFPRLISFQSKHPALHSSPSHFTLDFYHRVCHLVPHPHHRCAWCRAQCYHSVKSLDFWTPLLTMYDAVQACLRKYQFEFVIRAFQTCH